MQKSNLISPVRKPTIKTNLLNSDIRKKKQRFINPKSNSLKKFSLENTFSKLNNQFNNV